MKRHPIAIAWDEYRRIDPRVFEGSAAGTYLENRLQRAFNAGYEACQQAAEKAWTDAREVRHPLDPV